MHETLSIEREGGVATLTVTRPPVNALSLVMLESMAEELHRLGDDPEVSAIVWRSGVPGIFSGGFDLNDPRSAGAQPLHFPPGDHLVRVRNAQTALARRARADHRRDQRRGGRPRDADARALRHRDRGPERALRAAGDSRSTRSAGRATRAASCRSRCCAT